MHFPVFADIGDKPCLVVGAGTLAARKARILEDFGARIVQVSPETCGRPFVDSDIDGMALVVAATGDRAVNRRVAGLCREKGIPVNVVDDPENCTFFFPAVFRKGPMVVAVSSGGACPAAAKMVRDRIAGLVPDGFAAEVERLGASREKLKKDIPDPARRSRFCEEELKKWFD
jgi:siroheme synthase-like protein